VPSKEASESQKYFKTTDTRKLHGNTTVRRMACPVAWELSFCLPRDALPLPQFALLHSVPRVQLSLITSVGNCGYVAVASFLGVLSPYRFRINQKLRKMKFEYGNNWADLFGQLHVQRGNLLNLYCIVACRVVRATKITGSSSDDWIYWHFGCKFS
jgi:hypothetical protein